MARSAAIAVGLMVAIGASMVCAQVEVYLRERSAQPASMPPAPPPPEPPPPDGAVPDSSLAPEEQAAADPPQQPKKKPTPPPRPRLAMPSSASSVARSPYR